MPGRILAIGDIHGCDVALETILQTMAPKAEDTVIVLGDVIDRGPNTRRAIDLLIELQDNTDLVFLMGNHEEMLLSIAFRTGQATMEDWLSFGGQESLDSYGGKMKDIPEEHLEFLATQISYEETETDIFVHAVVDAELPLEEQPPGIMRWGRLTGNELRHCSGKRVVCGHTCQQSGVPLVFDGWVCIDTWVYGDGFLTCLDVESNIFWQANQQGELLAARPLTMGEETG